MNAVDKMLKTAGMRVTHRRVGILRTLAKASRPLSVAALLKSVGGTMDKVTLYRALQSLVASGLVLRVDLEHDHAHYELAQTHHHHLICSRCGAVEDTLWCGRDIERRALKYARNFKTIERHTLSFFGLCKRCI